MEAITILKNETNNHRIVQIDIDQVAADTELLDELYDFLAIELRRKEDTISWADIKKQIPQ